MLDDRTWLLIGRKMANEASTQELQELESILRSNPELHFSLQTISDLWQLTPAQNTPELETAYAQMLAKMKSQGSPVPGLPDDDLIETSSFINYRPRRWYTRTSAIFASALFVITLAIVWFASPFGNKRASETMNAREAASEISTRYGSKTNIVLPDGSKVWLNAGSKITYDKDFGETTRDVQLTGEAYFDVVHNSAKPFLIHTRAMDIKVLGTEFNVKSYPDEKTTETSLIRGSIEVTLKVRRADKIVLKPNEKLVVSNDESSDSVKTPKKSRADQLKPIISLSTLNYFSLDSTIMETSWVDNRLIFEDESFEEIARKMTRWYGVDFHFKDEEIKQLRFTGNFKDETIDDALAAMQITADFKYSISDNHATITKH